MRNERIHKHSIFPFYLNSSVVLYIWLGRLTGVLWPLLFQVDSSETLSDSDAEAKALTKVHSIGVQVEDDKR